MKIIKKNESLLSKSFTKIPNKVFKHNLTPVQVTILVYLLTHRNNFNLTKQQAHRDIGIARDTLNTNLKKIEKLGLISIDTNRLTIDYEAIMSNHPTSKMSNKTTEVFNEHTSMSSNSTNNVQSVDTYKNNNTRENTNNKKEQISIPRRIEDFPKNYQMEFYRSLLNIVERSNNPEVYFNNREEGGCKIEFDRFKVMLNDEHIFNPQRNNYLQSELNVLTNSIKSSVLQDSLIRMVEKYKKNYLGLSK